MADEEHCGVEARRTVFFFGSVEEKLQPLRRVRALRP
jgi:hypothetical protein